VGFALAGSLVAQVARAESQAEIAEKENEDGKALMFQGNYKGATEKFRDAEDQIKTDAQTQHVDLQPAGGGGGPTNVEGGGSPPDPNSGGGGTTTEGNPAVGGGGPVSTGGPPVQYAVGRPTQNLTTIAPPTHNYTWTLGVDFFGGGGRVGRDNVFGTSSGGVRLKADYMIMPQFKVGLQAYLQIQHFGQGTMEAGSALETLDVFDIGVAAYKHFCGTSRLCLTPLAGIQLALMSPADEMDGEGSQVFNYAAVGGRLEVALSYALGTRLEHVLSLQVGANIYSPVLASPADGSGLGTAGEVGLDTGGAAGYVGLGYTYRFDTPFGQAPFITLE
jgi:hypothetical protein